jgi:hypothetical protein
LGVDGRYECKKNDAPLFFPFSHQAIVEVFLTGSSWGDDEKK